MCKKRLQLYVPFLSLIYQKNNPIFLSGYKNQQKEKSYLLILGSNSPDLYRFAISANEIGLICPA